MHIPRLKFHINIFVHHENACCVSSVIFDSPRVPVRDNPTCFTVCRKPKYPNSKPFISCFQCRVGKQFWSTLSCCTRNSLIFDDLIQIHSLDTLFIPCRNNWHTEEEAPARLWLTNSYSTTFRDCVGVDSSTCECFLKRKFLTREADKCVWVALSYLWCGPELNYSLIIKLHWLSVWSLKHINYRGDKSQLPLSIPSVLYILKVFFTLEKS